MDQLGTKDREKTIPSSHQRWGNGKGIIELQHLENIEGYIRKGEHYR